MPCGPSHLVTLHWEDVSVSTKAGRPLLKRVNGIVRPGELCALMGASGAGKTTLLNTLLHRNTKGLNVEGGVFVNGQAIGSAITNVSGYVQQEDIFIGNLTVEEHLTIQATMRLSAQMNADERRQRVEEVMNAMLLVNSRNARIGVPGIRKGISGGEMKRLAFATEILTNPSILFCDEPTTGLDSHMAMLVVRQLEALANAGMTIVCTIHQPNSELFEMFDKVVFLSQGRIAFEGTPPQAVKFFAKCGHMLPDHTNPADYFIQCLAVDPSCPDESKARASTICDKFEDSELFGKVMYHIDDAQRPRKLHAMKKTNVFTLTYCHFYRYFLDNIRNPSMMRAKWAQKVYMGIFVAFLYLGQGRDKPNQDAVQNIKGALFFYISELTYATMFGIQTYLPGDFPLIAREFHDGLYPIFCYYIGRVLSYIPIFSIDGLIMMLLSYFMIGFSVSGVFVAVAICLLIELSAASLGIMMASISPSYAVAVSITGPILTIFSITGGLFTNVSEMPDWNRWVQYLSWFRYGYESFIINEWTDPKHNDIPCITSDGKNATGQYCYRSGHDVIEKLSFEVSNLQFNMIVMAIYVFTLLLIGYVGLVYRIQRAR